MAAQYDSDLASLKEQVKLLDFYYVEARYPNAMEDVIPAEFFSEGDADQAISMAQAVITSISRCLNTEMTDEIKNENQ